MCSLVLMMVNIHHKIKIVLMLLIFHRTNCTILRFPELYGSNIETNGVPNIQFQGIDQTIIYLRNVSNDDLIINTVLKNTYETQAVLLFSGEVEVTLKKIVASKFPNIILLTESLNIEDLEAENFKKILISHWSALYLVVTTRSQIFTCKNGTLTDKAFDETKKYLNILWQMFRIVRVSVMFPYTCPMHYVIYDGQEWSGTYLYNRDIRFEKFKTSSEFAIDLENSGKPRVLTNGYPLRTHIFQRFPTAITECDVVKQFTNIDYDTSHSLCGLDGMVMHDFIAHYKYQVLELVDENCNKYGYEINNTASGSLGCILRDEIDISFNSRFLWWYTSKRFHYLYHVSHDTLCAVIKRSNRIPLWHYPFNVFTIFTWILLLLLLSLLGIVTWFVEKIASKYTGENIMSLSSYMCNSVHSALFGILLKNDRKYGVLLKGVSLLCSIILLASYQGHYNYQFTTRSHYTELKYPEQLYTSSHIIYTTQSVLNFIKPIIDPNNNSITGFFKRIRIRNATSIDYLLQHSVKTPAATMERKRDIKIEVGLNHTDKYGKPEVYLMDMAFHMFYLSTIGRDGFLFIEESQKFMMRMTEAGLPSKYYSWTGYTFYLGDNWPKVDIEPRPFKSIGVKKLRVAFALLLIGYVISGLVFFVERWIPRNKLCFITR